MTTPAYGRGMAPISLSMAIKRYATSVQKIQEMFFTSTKLKWINFLFYFFCIGTSAAAQVTQARRIEIPITRDIELYTAIPVDTSGIVLYRNFSGPGGSQLELTRLDTALAKIWKGYMTYTKGYSLVKAKPANGKIYFFFNGGPRNMNFLVMVSNPTDGSYTSVSIKNPIYFNATEFIASNDAILIAGYFNFRPIVLYYSLIEKKTRILPGFLNEPGEIVQIKTYPDGNIDIVISAKNFSRKKSIWIRHFDKAGDLIKTVVIEPNENKHLIFGRVANLGDSNQVVAGVYGRNKEYARGIFIADVNTYGEYRVRYYSFADLKNFFHYMKARREKRIKDRIERRKIKGKRTKFNYRLIVHELIPYNDQFILLGEAFIPRYTNRNFGGPWNTTTSPWRYGIYDSYYRNYNNQVFDGYEYTHAVTIGFDKNANLVWDNSFEINDIKVPELQQFVKIFAGQEHILLAYLFENKLRTKIIRNDQVIEGTGQSQIKTNDGQTDLETRHSKLEYWYDKHFFVSGIQDFKSREGARKVFFISKLRAH
jgi:hypothetical protein